MNKVTFGLLFFFSYGFSIERCDISDEYTRSITEKSLFIWSLLDLAEGGVIVDNDLFCDELCRASLVLCKEVQQLTESFYGLSDEQIYSYRQLFDHLHKKFVALPEKVLIEKSYVNAIDIILQYVPCFLQEDISIYSDIKTS